MFKISIKHGKVVMQVTVNNSNICCCGCYLDLRVGPKEGEDEMDEGHEEWLSEGILTDDDFNPAQADQNKTDSNINTSQDDTPPSINESDLVSAQSKNIEDTLDNLQRSNQTELPEELGAFLIRKTDGRVIDDKKEESELDESAKQSEDDGHDTDELLRMLGEDNSSKKDGVKKLEQKRTHESQSSDDDDDEYIFEGTKVARLKVAKNAILKKYPSKAVPEETSDRDTDVSSDEGLTVKRMFGVSRKLNVASKSTAKSSINALKTVTKKVVSLPKVAVKTPATSTPLQKSVNTKVAKMKMEPDEIIDEEEFLDEEQFDLDEEFESDMEAERTNTQRIMRPEQMDEEVPTDGDSHSEDDSLYDELPSSDSEDLNEWFTLDIRSERAGDYIPLLGAKAHQLLTAEKQRVSTRLTTLKQSVSALNESSAQQAEMLRRATLQLAELDAALKA